MQSGSPPCGLGVGCGVPAFSFCSVFVCVLLLLFGVWFSSWAVWLLVCVYIFEELFFIWGLFGGFSLIAGFFGGISGVFLVFWFSYGASRLCVCVYIAWIYAVFHVFVCGSKTMLASGGS